MFTLSWKRILHDAMIGKKVFSHVLRKSEKKSTTEFLMSHSSNYDKLNVNVCLFHC